MEKCIEEKACLLNHGNNSSSQLWSPEIGMSFQSIGQPTKSSAASGHFKVFWGDILNCFRSVHLAIVLLSLLAIGTIIGVVMPQEGMVEIADIQQRYGSNFEFYRNFGFFNVYSSFWFITLQILFFFNLLIGSFKWLKPATLAALQKNTLSPELMVHKPETHSFSRLWQGPREGFESGIAPILKRFGYKVVSDGEGGLYASKGNISRLGPCISHLGILLCLIAGVYSSFTGFKAVRMAVPGETFSVMEANTFKTNIPEPLWIGSVPEWKIRVNDFQVEFYKDHPETAKQYFSKLDVVSPEGKVLKSETISVNHPLLYDNLSIYQASYAPTGRFKVDINGQPKMLDINSEFNQRPISVNPLANGSSLIMFPFFAGQDPGVSENYAVFFVRKPNEAPTAGKMPENLKLTAGETGTLKGMKIHYINPEMSTGLQIKRAPEVPLMYLSYLIIALGATLCFFSQRQLWLNIREVSPGQSAVMVTPKTNKARLSFQKELSQLEYALFKTIATQSKPVIKES